MTEEHPGAVITKVKPGWERFFEVPKKVLRLKVVSIVYSWKKHNSKKEGEK